MATFKIVITDTPNGKFKIGTVPKLERIDGQKLTPAQKFGVSAIGQIAMMVKRMEAAEPPKIISPHQVS